MTLVEHQNKILQHVNQTLIEVMYVSETLAMVNKGRLEKEE